MVYLPFRGRSWFRWRGGPASSAGPGPSRRADWAAMDCGRDHVSLLFGCGCKCLRLNLPQSGQTDAGRMSEAALLDNQACQWEQLVPAGQ